MKITAFTADGMNGCFVTDRMPAFSFACDEAFTEASLSVGGKTCSVKSQIGIRPEGVTLQPHTDYEAVLRVSGPGGKDEKSFLFRTGKLQEAWTGQWITDGSYVFTEKKVSPKIMVFRRAVRVNKPIRRAEISATALGIYELSLNGQKVGDRCFAPGFTSYAHDLQYQTYDVTAQLQLDNVLTAEVAGGWAVGSFVFTRANRITADRQALLLELRVLYEDGTEEVIGTDASWQAATDGPVKMADLYDGETYDATVDLAGLSWHPAALETVKIHPVISADIGLPVTRHETFAARYLSTVGGADIYDFGQNMAAQVSFHVKGRKGQVITIRHAEILNGDGSLNLSFLRSAKATLTYTCRDGEQDYIPRFTYMGFRYISVEGAAREDIRLTAHALYSDIADGGHFSCSSELLNRLNENIRWGAKSNFVEIPTDCPQRDERMGWTGDIAVFAPTACWNFDMTRFLRKWLRDVRSEQFRGGGIPNTVPAQSYGFPTTMPNMAVDWWDDACILVPWAIYQATGDEEILREMYPTMQRYVKACRFWAGIWGLGKYRYIWHTPAVFHFGDWVAADAPKMSQWQGRSKWTATASLCNCAALTGRIAEILGKKEDAAKYAELSRKAADAYQSILMTKDGHLKKQEFQTGYVLPLYFHMLDEEHRKAAAANLAAMVRKGNYCIGTGFPGTPYILFALADNGYADVAYEMLMNTRCPSWLYEVKAGATTIWERWDGLDENGQCPIGNDGTGVMISYNHYASGAVGDFLYRRVLGVEAVEPGYRSFRMAPLPGGGLTWAKGDVNTPYGQIAAGWKLDGKECTVQVTVPGGTRCTLKMPDGREETLQPGTWTRSCTIA